MIHVRLEAGRKACGDTGGIDTVPAVVESGRRAEIVEHLHVRRCGGTDESELASRHGERGEIVPRDGDSAGKGSAGRFHVSKDQRGLRFGRIEPIVVGLSLACCNHQAARLLGQLASPFEITGQQP